MVEELGCHFAPRPLLGVEAPKLIFFYSISKYSVPGQLPKVPRRHVVGHNFCVEILADGLIFYELAFREIIEHLLEGKSLSNVGHYKL